MEEEQGQWDAGDEVWDTGGVRAIQLVKGEY